VIKLAAFLILMQATLSNGVHHFGLAKSYQDQGRKEEIEIDLEKKRVVFRATGISPCIIHGNGPGQVLYQEIYDTLFAD